MAKPRTFEQIKEILNHVRFLDRSFHLYRKGDGFLLQIHYMEADIETGNIELQKSRKHYVSPFMTETEIVDTAFYAVMRSMEHTTREHFLYKGELVKSPHFHIDAILAVAKDGLFDGREP